MNSDRLPRGTAKRFANSNARNFSLYRCRCNRRVCQARRTLTKHPANYEQWPICQICRKGKLYVDWYRTSKQYPKDGTGITPANQCYCDGVWFSIEGAPHKKGSKWCIHYTGNYTCEDYEDQQHRMKDLHR